MSQFEMDPFDTGVEWICDDTFSLVVEGMEIVRIDDVGDDGTATVIVYSSTGPEAPIIFRGTVNILAHRTKEN